MAAAAEGGLEVAVSLHSEGETGTEWSLGCWRLSPKPTQFFINKAQFGRNVQTGETWAEAVTRELHSDGPRASPPAPPRISPRALLWTATSLPSSTWLLLLFAPHAPARK